MPCVLEQGPSLKREPDVVFVDIVVVVVVALRSA